MIKGGKSSYDPFFGADFEIYERPPDKSLKNYRARLRMDYLWRHQLPATLLDIGHWDSTRILTIGSSSSEKKVVMASLASSILSLGKAWFRDALRILGTFSLDLDDSSTPGIFWDWIIHSHIHRIFMIGHFLRLSDAKYHPHHSNSLLSKAVRYLASSSILFPTKLSLSYKIVSPSYENVFS